MTESVMEGIIATLAAHRGVVDAGPLIKTLHAALSLSQRKSNQSESENVARYKQELGLRSIDLITMHHFGVFKPAGFVHNFDEYYSTPGYLDEKVLLAFFRAANCRALDPELRKCQEFAAYLSFIYIGFLVIHPFVDGNGRVVRALLDYHYNRLGYSFHRKWHGQGFTDLGAHKRAFKSFFQIEAGVPSRTDLNLDHPYPIQHRLRPYLERLASNAEIWFNEVAEGAPFTARASIMSLKNAMVEDHWSFVGLRQWR